MNKEQEDKIERTIHKMLGHVVCTVVINGDPRCEKCSHHNFHQLNADIFTHCHGWCGAHKQYLDCKYE